MRFLILSLWNPRGLTIWNAISYICSRAANAAQGAKEGYLAGKRWHFSKVSRLDRSRGDGGVSGWRGQWRSAPMATVQRGGLGKSTLKIALGWPIIERPPFRETTERATRVPLSPGGRSVVFFDRLRLFSSQPRSPRRYRVSRIFSGHPVSRIHFVMRFDTIINFYVSAWCIFHLDISRYIKTRL